MSLIALSLPAMGVDLPFEDCHCGMVKDWAEEIKICVGDCMLGIPVLVSEKDKAEFR